MSAPEIKVGPLGIRTLAGVAVAFVLAGGAAMAAPLATPALGAGQNILKETGEVTVPGVGSPTVVRYTWRDSAGKPRSVSLVPASPTNSGYAVQMSYQLPSNATVYVNATADGDGGFGYFVSHELFRSFDDRPFDDQGTISATFHGEDDSPFGRYLPSTGSDSTVAANQAVHEYRLSYPRWGTVAAIPQPDGVVVSANPANHQRYLLPVIIRWTFIAGRDYPLWSVDYDLSSAADHISTDVRGPYGVMDFNEGITPKVTAVKWGDRYVFSANAGAADFGPAAEPPNGVSWTWNAVNNGRRYNVLAAGSYEFGIVDTRTAATSKYADGYADPLHRGSVKVAGESCSYSMLAMPCDYEWAYQSFQYDYDPTRPKLAWGSSPFLGTSYTQVYDGTQDLPLVGAKGRISYGVNIVMGKSASGAPQTLALAAAAVEADSTLTIPAPSGGGTVSYTVLGDSGGPYTTTRSLTAWSSVRLTATPAVGYQLTSWGGDCAGVTGTLCMLAMDAAKNVTATFALSGGGPTGPALAVNAAAARRTISDDIYGMNYVDEALAQELRMPVRRWGGNSTSRYNYQIDSHNTGSDFYFENIPDGDGTENGRSSNQFIDQDRRTATRTLMTVPTIGWVPKRRLNNHPYDCGFKMSKYPGQGNPPDDNFTPVNDDQYDPDCAKGRYANGGYVVGNDPTDTSVAIAPSFVTGWVNYLKARYGAASAGGVAYYSLDNEPGLWNSTHRDVHPLGMTFNELRDRGWQYGAAIKAADPSAKTLGPAEWGWCSYFYSPADPGGCGPGPDRTAHGDLPTVVWYLQQMKSYEQANGVRILDYLDLHFYPQADNVALAPAGDAANQALRLRSTRALWDPTYEDESYIKDLDTGAFLRMIPRMKDWITANYPGTKTAISEYNWGAAESINGALAQAEVLGIFGREGLDLATLWEPPSTSQPLAYAFRVYRNYDGTGKGFGETSIQATSADPNTLSIFGAQRSSDGALTVVVINKSAGDLSSNVALSGINLQAAASVYRYSGAAPAAIQKLADQPIASSAFTATFPANSITLFVIPMAAVADPLGDADNDGIPNGVEPMEGRDPNVKDNDIFAIPRLFAMQQYRDFLGREGDAGGIQFYVDLLNNATASRETIISSFLASPEFASGLPSIIRLYFSFFGRIPDYGGLTFQVTALRQGTALELIAQNFYNSPEFTNRYGALTNDAYINLVYQNVLGRAPDPGGFAFYKNLLDTNAITKGQMMIGFSESPEFQALTDNKAWAISVYVGLLRRTPEQAGLDFYVNLLDNNTPRIAIIPGFYNSPEYHNRFLP